MANQEGGSNIKAVGNAPRKTKIGDYLNMNVLTVHILTTAVRAHQCNSYFSIDFWRKWASNVWLDYGWLHDGHNDESHTHSATNTLHSLISYYSSINFQYNMNFGRKSDASSTLINIHCKLDVAWSQHLRSYYTYLFSYTLFIWWSAMSKACMWKVQQQ